MADDKSLKPDRSGWHGASTASVDGASARPDANDSSAVRTGDRSSGQTSPGAGSGDSGSPTTRTGTRQEANRLRTRRLILDAAYDLFEEKGYDKTTMRLLAQRAGVGQGTIFKHFSDKSQLLLAAFREDMTAIMMQAFDDLPEADLKTRMVHLVRAAWSFYAVRPVVGRALLREALFLDGDAAAEMDPQGFKNLWPRMMEVIRQAGERGELDPEADPMLVMEGFWAFYTYALMKALRSRPFDMDGGLALLARMVDVFLDGAAPSPIET